MSTMKKIICSKCDRQMRRIYEIKHDLDDKHEASFGLFQCAECSFEILIQEGPTMLKDPIERNHDPIALRALYGEVVQ